MIICSCCQTEYLSSEKNCPNCGFAVAIYNGVLLWAPEQYKINYNPENFAFFAELENNYFWFEARKKLLLHCLKKYFSGFGSLLEVGCGTGYLLSSVAKAFPQADLYASDVFIEALNFTAKKFQGRAKSPILMRLDARDIPYREEFDAIVALDVLEHIEEDSLVIKNFFAATKKGGGLIVTVPQHQRLWGKADEDAGHVRRYEISDLREKIKAAGYSVIFSGSFVSLLLPAIFLSRRRGGKNNPQFKELGISSGLNRLLSGIMTLEYHLIKLGLRFPWGGSRLLVAKKLA
ncbi:MAG: class I SAM-dependent methyltransferase [Deltaproteobacteria bacterium]|jgi:2-polyprenyl-3-methyl-5-hydroxy-6-metoxy-1,4-benzoquinol methylase|nr:class I SAM-dependent methyltransferase [Deltaproteobacteria bacterium]